MRRPPATPHSQSCATRRCSRGAGGSFHGAAACAPQARRARPFDAVRQHFGGDRHAELGHLPAEPGDARVGGRRLAAAANALLQAAARSRAAGALGRPRRSGGCRHGPRTHGDVGQGHRRRGEEANRRRDGVLRLGEREHGPRTAQVPCESLRRTGGASVLPARTRACVETRQSLEAWHLERVGQAGARPRLERAESECSLVSAEPETPETSPELSTSPRAASTHLVSWRARAP